MVRASATGLSATLDRAETDILQRIYEWLSAKRRSRPAYLAGLDGARVRLAVLGSPRAVLMLARLRPRSARAYLARRASLSESEISTLLPSNRIQPRWAKSASALFTVSRDAPTS